MTIDPAVSELELEVIDAEWTVSGRGRHKLQIRTILKYEVG